jgi:small-conductance mechanosensitive channel
MNSWSPHCCSRNFGLRTTLPLSFSSILHCPVLMVRAAISRAVALPLLVLLHLLFSLFSLALRITQSVSRTGAVIRQVSVPRHIALSLPSSSHRKGASHVRAKPAVRLRERRALLETLKRTVRWAGEDGVKELSVYTDLGMGCNYLTRLC